MKSSERKKEAFLLTNENMNEAAKRLNKELEEYGEKEDRLRLRLAFEDILDTWRQPGVCRIPIPIRHQQTSKLREMQSCRVWEFTPYLNIKMG